MKTLTHKEKQVLIDNGYISWLAKNGYKTWLAVNGYKEWLAVNGYRHWLSECGYKDTSGRIYTTGDRDRGRDRDIEQLKVYLNL